MSGPFAHIARCLDLHESDVARALGERGTTLALLVHLASISAPNTGVAKVLIVYARMATTGCNWIDGDLSIDLAGDVDVTVIDAATGLGGGLRERLFAPLSFRAPITEFSRAIERVPHMIVPLVIRAKSARRVSLSATAALRRTSAPPPPIEISSDSLFVHPSPDTLPKAASGSGSPVAVPDDVDGGWDE